VEFSNRKRVLGMKIEFFNVDLTKTDDRVFDFKKNHTNLPISCAQNLRKTESTDMNPTDLYVKSPFTQSLLLKVIFMTNVSDTSLFFQS
jgi:hypothetical protein